MLENREDSENRHLRSDYRDCHVAGIKEVGSRHWLFPEDDYWMKEVCDCESSPLATVDWRK